ncbi:MAG: GNAT family N-acetyltransferase [Geminicoccaceae bacterium]
MRRSFLVPETLETERLRLRLPRAEDFPAYAAMLADPEVNRFVGGAGLADRAEAYRAFGWLFGHWHLRGYGPWLVEDRASGALVGRVGGFHPLEWPAMEIAWTLDRAWWGRGLAQEAATAARETVREHLRPDRLISVVALDNEPSQRLARRLGCRAAERIAIWGIDCIVFDHPA